MIILATVESFCNGLVGILKSLDVGAGSKAKTTTRILFALLLPKFSRPSELISGRITSSRVLQIYSCMKQTLRVRSP